MSKRDSARIYRPTQRNLKFLARCIRAGELVAVPTETVYGLAANALDPEACAQIFEVKGRPAYDPLIVHVFSISDVAEIVHWNNAAQTLAQKFWPGPLTFVLPKKLTVPPLVTAGLDSVAVRMPAHPVMRQFLKLTRLPLAAPSANPFGYISPTTAEHVQESLGRRIKFILDGGPSIIGLESTIIDLRNPLQPVLLRPGAVTKIQLEDALGRRVKTPLRSTKKSADILTAQRAPGSLARHYSPRTPVVLHSRISEAFLKRRCPGDAYVLLRRPARMRRRNVFWFDSQGDLPRIARRLFAMLRKVDRLNFKTIHVQLAAKGGLGDAINDRLQRAAAR